MIGEGSISHNERKFIAHNVDASRTAENLVLISEDIKEVYHELFDEALERYNAKQSRKDRKIENYYEHIRTGRQEKLFHEVIFQIGNKDDTGCLSDEGQITKSVLVEFAKEFQTRNPQFKVFGVYLHVDEATPHLHIDFVPYMTGSKRGLDTRVSLKQALASRGFKGKSKSETEWNQWMESEKEELSKVAERYDIQWEQKGTHREHLSVLDFKKEMRTQEVKDLEQQKEDMEKQVGRVKNKVERYEKKLDHLQPIIDNMSKEIEDFSASVEELLPKAGTLEMGSGYREKKAKPLCIKMKKRISSLAAAYMMVKEELGNMRKENKKLVEENRHLKEKCEYLKKENKGLRKVQEWFEIVVKVFGRNNINRVIEKAEERARIEAEEKVKKDCMQKLDSIRERLAEKKQAINQKQKKIKNKEMKR